MIWKTLGVGSCFRQRQRRSLWLDVWRSSRSQREEVDASQHAVVALCVSELVSNVVRHAYPGGRVGDVRMLVCIDDGSVQLVVVDHGVGFQDADTPGVGMGIVESLCESVVWERFEDGSTCVFARLAASGGPNSGFDQPQSVGYGAR